MKPQRLDVTVWLILVGIALALAGVLGANTFVGVRVERIFPGGGDQVDDTGRIGLQFAEAMQQSSVEPRFSVSPAVSGTIQWDGNTLWFTPASPWRPGITYTARLQAGATSRLGRTMRLATEWTFSAHTPWIVYLAPALGSVRRLWRIPSSGGNPQPLTASGVGVQDFGVSPDGRQIAYSQQNAQGGLDLWLMAGDGQNAQLLVSCADSMCSGPAWSPDGRQIAFSRHSPGLTPGTSGPARVMLVDPASRQAQPLFDDPQIVSDNPVWSPDGRYVAATGGEDYRVRVLNLASGQTWLLPSPLGNMTWSPDSRALLYLDIESVDGKMATTIQRADVAAQSHATVKVIDAGAHVGQLAWSPGGDWVLAAQHEANQPGTDQQLWLLTPDWRAGQTVTGFQGYVYPEYHWDPWGQAVVMQRFRTGLAKSTPELVVWTKATNKLTVLIADAASPAWQP